MPKRKRSVNGPYIIYDKIGYLGKEQKSEEQNFTFIVIVISSDLQNSIKKILDNLFLIF